MFNNINVNADSCRDWSAYTCLKCNAAVIGYNNYLDHKCKPSNGKDKPVNAKAANFMGIK